MLLGKHPLMARESLQGCNRPNWPKLGTIIPNSDPLILLSLELVIRFAGIPNFHRWILRMAMTQVPSTISNLGIHGKLRHGTRDNLGQFTRSAV